MSVLGMSPLGKFLGHIDATYASLFMDYAWRDSFEKIDAVKLGKFMLKEKHHSLIINKHGDLSITSRSFITVSHLFSDFGQSLIPLLRIKGNKTLTRRQRLNCLI